MSYAVLGVAYLLEEVKGNERASSGGGACSGDADVDVVAAVAST